ncbi:hypothetical protein B0H16DRAFT_1590489 [Mycena metata]|uniref:Uncharacterized protein n=1 Tax=Mycena metata TaxID=1033252 RepID=A0AAD7HU80_9AGAR|nr:hypothetical protein B0H16DRAFT_1590489 [Mycena metata]
MYSAARRGFTLYRPRLIEAVGRWCGVGAARESPGASGASAPEEAGCLRANVLDTGPRGARPTRGGIRWRTTAAYVRLQQRCVLRGGVAPCVNELVNPRWDRVDEERGRRSRGPARVRHTGVRISIAPRGACRVYALGAGARGGRRSRCMRCLWWIPKGFAQAGCALALECARTGRGREARRERRCRS